MLPFGTLVSSEDDKASGIVGDGGSVYLTGLSAQGTLHAVWGRDSAQRCTIRYALNPQNYHARTGLYSRRPYVSNRPFPPLILLMVITVPRAAMTCWFP